MHTTAVIKITATYNTKNNNKTYITIMSLVCTWQAPKDPSLNKCVNTPSVYSDFDPTLTLAIVPNYAENGDNYTQTTDNNKGTHNMPIAVDFGILLTAFNMNHKQSNTSSSNSNSGPNQRMPNVLQ